MRIIKNKNFAFFSLIMSSLLFISCNNEDAIKKKNEVNDTNITRINFEEVLANAKIGFTSNYNDEVIITNAISNADTLNTEITAIIELEDEDLIAGYVLKNNVISFDEYYGLNSTIKEENNLINKQVKLVKSLLSDGIIKEVTGNYSVLMNAIAVKTTYSQLEVINSYSGVANSYVSPIYNQPSVVKNNTNTYDTGIYENNTQYDGSNTIVAVLDSGFDYSHEVFQMDIKTPAKSKEFVESILESTRAYAIEEGNLTIDDVYLSNKVPFAYDYADKKADVYPIESDHGTHVSGIIGGESSVIKGIAPQTQFAWMKVFNDKDGGGDTADIIEALEDAVLLGVDAINLSLGSVGGYSEEIAFESEVDKTSYRVNQIYNKIEQAGISLLSAAGNEYSSAYQSTYGTNLTSNPESGDISAPASYSASLAVASINGNLDPYALINGSDSDAVFFQNAYDSRSVEHKFADELFEKAKNDDSLKKNEDGSFELDYVCVPGYGLKINYTGLDVKGKIALVKRGNITFEEKLKNAFQAGAYAVLIYNNVSGVLTMTVGETVYCPVAMISSDSGNALVNAGNGTLKFNESYVAGPFMSDFSSWGPLADLTLKPEITAHGGNIYSSVLGGKYDSMSGTSMATPNTCGIVIVIRDYVKERWPDLTPVEVTKRVNQLLMSTATICLNEVGNPYSPRKQGAGLASLVNAVTSNAYLFVEDNSKTKLELKDDKQKSGVYECNFAISNISNKELSYDVKNLTMSETVSENDDNKTVAETAYMLNPNMSVEVGEGLTYKDNKIYVPANTSSTIKVTLKLTDKDKEYLNDNFENGMYVEGFIRLLATDANEVNLSIPFLAFFGDWLSSPMFDVSYYDVEKDKADDAISEKDKTKAAMYATTPYGKYLEYYLIPLGSYIYELDDGYDKIAASVDKAAISIDDEATIYGLYSIYAGLMRGAKELTITISNTNTGEVYFEKTTYNNRKCLYYGGSGGTIPYTDEYNFLMYDEEKGEVFANNTEFTIKMVATLDYEDGENVANNTFETSFYCDYETPSLENVNYLTEYDKSEKKNRYYVELDVSDNRYVQSIRPCTIIDNTLVSLTDNPIPVYQENANETTRVKIEITDFFNDLANSDYPDTIFYIINDYALNQNIFYTALGGCDYQDLKFNTDIIEISPNEKIDLNSYVNFENAMLQGLTWTTSNDDVAVVNQSEVIGLKKGIATITGTSKYYGTSIQVKIKVKENSTKDNVISKIEYSGYTPNFVFDDDYEYSDYGYVDTFYYMPDENSFELYPSESLTLSYEISPWYANKDNLEVRYSSEDEEYVSVDQDGKVTAIKETVSAINIKATVYENGKETIYSATTSVSVKSPFITSGISLMYYKGWGGTIEIPDDLGIQYIYDYAFAHYIYKGIDPETGYAKQVALGDPYINDDKEKVNLYATPITKIILSTGIRYINTYAFYGLSYLEEVCFSDTYDNGKLMYIDIKSSAFENCSSLKKINLNNVQKIENYAFKNTSLEDVNEDSKTYGLDMSSVITMGKEAFMNTKLKKATLTSLRYSGVSLFEGCKELSVVSLHKDTPLSKYMFKDSGINELTLYQNIIPEGFAENATCLNNLKLEINSDLTIKENAFKGSGVKDITLPNFKVNIENNAFYESALRSISLGNNTTLNLSGTPFAKCISFNSIKLDSYNTNYSLVNGMLTNASKDELLLVPNATKIEIPATIKIIKESSCNGNLSTKLVIPSTVEIIEDYAFASSSLKEVTLNINAKYGSHVFEDCNNLSYVNNLDKLTNISSFMFANCNITDVRFIDNVIIAKASFKGNTSLTGITFLGKANIGDYAFYEALNENSTIAYNDEITIGNFAFAKSGIKKIDSDYIMSLGEGAFKDAYNLAFVNVANATLDIGVFEGAKALQKVTLKDNIDIPYHTFYDCENLNSVDINNIASVGEYAFYNTSSLTKINLANASFIKDGAFKNSGIEEANLANVSYLGARAFENTNSLASVKNLSNKLKEIKEYTFYSEEISSPLASIDLSHIETIGDYAFFGNSELVSLNLTCLVNVGQYAFVGSGLNAAKLTSLKEAGDYAFYSLPIKTLEIPVLEIAGKCAFAEIYAESVELPETLKEIKYAAFSGIVYNEAFTHNNEKNYTKYDENNNPVWSIYDGVLYTYLPNGKLNLASYPSYSKEKVYHVVEGCERIDAYAFYTTRSYMELEEIYFPYTLSFIGDCAFGGVESLKTYHFASYQAPILEGCYNESLQTYLYNLTDSDLENEPLANELYKIDVGRAYNMYYYYYPYYYANFYDYVGFVNDLTMYYPKNGVGYDSLIYTSYFANREVEKAVADEITNKAIASLNNLLEIKEANKDNLELIYEAYNDYIAIYDESQKELVSEELYNHLITLYNEALDISYPKVNFETLKEIKGDYKGLDSDGNSYNVIINEDGTGKIIFNNISYEKLNKSLTFDCVRNNDTKFMLKADNGVDFIFTYNDDKSIDFKYYVSEVNLVDETKKTIEPDPTPTPDPTPKNDKFSVLWIIIPGISLLIISILAILYIFLKKKKGAN